MSASSNFWSRRKEAVQAERQKDEELESAKALAAEQQQLEEKSDEEILAELELPDPDTLEEGDDFSVFMSKAVPDRLRRRALRKLWGTNPILANVDGLVDYGEDFTDAATVIENLQTTYQVGKGMLTHVMEMARQEEEKEKADALAAAEPAPEDDDLVDFPGNEDAQEEDAPVELVEQGDHVNDTAEIQALPTFEDDPVPDHRPRRMRFSYAAQDTEATT